MREEGTFILLLIILVAAAGLATSIKNIQQDTRLDALEQAAETPND